MAAYKTIDIIGAVDHAKLCDDQQIVLQAQTLAAAAIRGEQLLLRFTLYMAAHDDTVFNIPAGAGLEFVLTDGYQATLESQVLAYADDTEFDSTLWGSWSKSGGKVCCAVSLNTSNLLAALGSDASATYHAALLMTPPGGS